MYGRERISLPCSGLSTVWRKDKKVWKNWSSPEEARADRVLRIRDSTGKATARKFN